MGRKEAQGASRLQPQAWKVGHDALWAHLEVEIDVKLEASGRPLFNFRIQWHPS
jgi:hypothetical protein